MFHPVNLRKPRILNLSSVGLAVPFSFISFTGLVSVFSGCFRLLTGLLNSSGPKIGSYDTLLETSLLTPFSRMGQQTMNLSHYKII